jgi:hypothetical protein
MPRALPLLASDAVDLRFDYPLDVKQQALKVRLKLLEPILDVGEPLKGPNRILFCS